MRSLSLLHAATIIVALQLAATFAGSAAAAIFVEQDGTILGLRGVEVGSRFYDVEFVDGTCIELFTGCDDSGDFTFDDTRDYRDPRSAIAASLALREVLHPSGIAVVGNLPGCDPIALCGIRTPTVFDDVPVYAQTIFADPNPAGIPLLVQFLAAEDLSEAPFEVYARWTVVPEPSVAVLFGLSLCGLGAATTKHDPLRRRN